MSTALVATGPPAPGLYYGMAAEEYHAVESMSFGGAKKMLRSPAHYKLMRTAANEPTDSMEFGTVIHCGVLEPHALAARMATVPDDAPKRPSVVQLNAKRPSSETIESIAFWSSFEQTHRGKIVLSAGDARRATKVIAAVRAHPGAARLLDGCEIEGSMFWTDARYKVPCKARFDARNHGGLIDLKSCEDASPDVFARAIASYKYHVQGAHYCSGAEHLLDASPEFFAFIAAETSEPFGVACYYLPGNAILAGGHWMNIALGRYADALASGKWRGYPDSIELITLPKYALQLNV